MINVVIYGLGHIGGSLALSIRKNLSKTHRVTGIDISTTTLRRVKEKKLFEVAKAETKQAALILSNADLVFVCVSPSNIEDVFKIINKNDTKKTLIVSDVASIKHSVMSLAKKHLKKISFVGGHPIAGTEKSGFQNADPNLFKNKIFIISGSHGTKRSIGTISSIWRKLGTRVLTLDPKKHDKVFAYLSHLPHALSFCLNKTALKSFSKNDIEKFGGSSYKDYSRISSSSDRLWTEIFLSNRKNLTTSLDDSIKFLTSLKDALSKGSSADVVKLIKTIN